MSVEQCFDWLKFCKRVCGWLTYRIQDEGWGWLTSCKMTTVIGKLLTIVF